jgi:hypothetical protein
LMPSPLIFCQMAEMTWVALRALHRAPGLLPPFRAPTGYPLRTRHPQGNALSSPAPHARLGVRAGEAGS